MKPIDRILAPIDEGSPSKVSLRYAAMISKALQAHLAAVHVVHELMAIPILEDRWVEEVEYEKREIRDTVSRIEEEFGIAIHLKIVQGIPIRTILEESDIGKYDLVIAGSRGKLSVEELVSGAFSRELVLHSTKPILVAKSYREPKKVMICTDGSEYSDVAVDYAGLIAEKTNAETELLYIGDIPRSVPEAARRLEKEAGVLRAHHVTPSAKLTVQGAASDILRAAEEFSADLIVMGWRSRGKVPGVGIGDLVLALLHKTDRPLLVHRRRYPDSIWY